MVMYWGNFFIDWGINRSPNMGEGGKGSTLFTIKMAERTSFTLERVMMTTFNFVCVFVIFVAFTNAKHWFSSIIELYIKKKELIFWYVLSV